MGTFLVERSGDEGVAVVRSAKQVLDLAVAQELEEAVRSSGTSVVTIDLGGIDYIDSVIISTIIKLHLALNARGGGIRLRSPSEYVRRLLEVTGVAGVIEIVE